jgi:hypothetical protein
VGVVQKLLLDQLGQVFDGTSERSRMRWQAPRRGGLLGLAPVGGAFV